MYESESKLRLQKVLELPDLDVIAQSIPVISVDSLRGQFTIAVTDADAAQKSSSDSRCNICCWVLCANETERAHVDVVENLILKNSSLEHEDTLLIAG